MELPRTGIKVTIDTIAKTIHIPLTDVVGTDIMKSQVEEIYFPYYDNITQSIEYKINSIEHNEHGILFHTQYNDKVFMCALVDSSFSVNSQEGTILSYVGGETAKQANKRLNDAKQMVFDSLTGN